MDDIVQRLRWWAAKKKPPHGMDTLPHDCAAGADEIERLTKIHKQAFELGIFHQSRADKAEAENAKLTVACAVYEVQAAGLREQLAAGREGIPMPQDVINLVIAAREAFDMGTLPDEESRALDKALEAFSSRIPYENQLDDGDHEDLP